MEEILLKRLVKDLLGIKGVMDAVISSSDGVPLAASNGGAEDMGSLAILLEATSKEMVSHLSLGSLSEAYIEGPDYKFLTINWGGYVIGVLLAKKVSTALLRKEITPLLEGILTDKEV
ncbi:MAG: roadblock/LC7 domain-containing protein [Euryarchaeota archaeon]|nr:roadblock/LC7 domain-containing protein [Euryarchaeota archaeon]